MSELDNIDIHKNKIIAFQGISGAYSEMACNYKFQSLETLPCSSFEEMIF